MTITEPMFLFLQSRFAEEAATHEEDARRFIVAHAFASQSETSGRQAVTILRKYSGHPDFIAAWA